MPKNLSRIAVSEVAGAVAGAPRGRKTQIVEKYAADLCVSVNTVWRAVRATRGATRKPRSDRRKTAVPEADIQAVEGIKLQAWRRGGRNLATEDAIQILEDRGVANGLSVSTANRRPPLRPPL